VLQIGRSLVRSQPVSLEFFIDFGTGVDSASNGNEYQEHFLGGKGGRCIRLTILPPSCAVVMKSGNLNFLEPSGPLPFIVVAVEVLTDVPNPETHLKIHWYTGVSLLHCCCFSNTPP